MAILEAPSPADGAVRKLDVYGYPSNMLIFSDPIASEGTDRQVVYSPLTQRFYEFANNDELRHWVETQAKDPVKREGFLRHWSLYNQEDGKTYAGVKTALAGIGAIESSDWRPEGTPFKFIQMEDTPVNGDLFAGIAKQARQDQASNADMLIVSNAQVQEAIIVDGLQAAESILLPLAMLSPEVFAIPAAIDAGAQTAIGIHETVDSERAADQTRGMVTTMSGLIDGIFSVYTEVPISKELSELQPVRFAEGGELGGEYRVDVDADKSVPRLEYELDLSTATSKQGSTSNTANAGGVWKLADKGNLFVKPSVAHLMKWQGPAEDLQMVYEGAPTTAEQQFFVKREVAATRQTELHALYANTAPEAFVGTKPADDGEIQYFVATKALENFKELGDILVDRSFVADQLASSHIAEGQKPAIRLKVDQLRQLQDKFEALKTNDPEWYKSDDIQLKADVEQMRSLRKQVVTELLSKDLRGQLLAHVMNDQVIGELDTVNTWGQNVGFMKTASGEWQMVAIDRGASYDIGFWGTAKGKDGYSTAKGQRPGILQSDMEKIFTPQRAQYSGELSTLGKDLSGYPYPEDIDTLLGVGINEIDRQEMLNRLVYQDLLLEGNGDTDSAFHQNFQILSDPPTERLQERGLMTRDQVVAIDKARRGARTEQAGGKSSVLRWAGENPVEANRLKELANAKRTKMGLPSVA
jgi:hypothetical protein